MIVPEINVSREYVQGNEKTTRDSSYFFNLGDHLDFIQVGNHACIFQLLS